MSIEPVPLAYRVVRPDPAVPSAPLPLDLPPLVLLHGGAAGGASWDGVADRLARDRTAYLPDLRGVGRSPRVGPYRMSVLRDDVLALLDGLDLDRAILVGHSSGGVVASLVAQAAPHRVAGLVLEECPPPVPLGLTIPTGLPASAPYYDREVRPHLLAELNAPDPAWRDGLELMSMPTLVLAGGPDSFLPQEELARMAAHIPGAELVTIAAGHHIHRDAPAAFTEAVDTFLGHTGMSGRGNDA